MLPDRKFLPVLATLLLVAATAAPSRAGQFAIEVVSYDAGVGASPGFNDPASALGSPTRYTGVGVFPGVVSPFNPPYLTSELVSIGEGGHLTLRLQSFAVSQPGGLELGVFVNVGLIDDDFPNGQVGDPPGAFGIDSALVDVSEDGLDWHSLGLHTFDVPTNAYTDVSPFSTVPGSILSDFGLPFDGTLADFAGLRYSDPGNPDVLSLLNGSGGGNWLDLPSGGQFAYVRFSVPDDGDPFTSASFELDAVVVATAAVGVQAPEPGTWLLMLSGLVGLALHRWRHRARKGLPAIVLAIALVGVVAPASAATLLLEDFATDPIAAGRATTSGNAARFSAVSGGVVAHYDSTLPTAKLQWALPRSLDQSEDFDFEVDFRIASDNLVLDQNIGGQISFGLSNSLTTGDDRAGGTTQDAFDVVALDYFPNISPAFGGPSLGPSVVMSDNGGSFFSRIEFPFGIESRLDVEGPLPLDVMLTARLSYESGPRRLTLHLEGPGGPLDINSGAFGGPDVDNATIQHTLPSSAAFSVDSFSLLLWEETFGFSTVRADVTFERVLVQDALAVPEPATWALLLTGLAAVGTPRVVRLTRRQST